jgi:hypothetical protein
LDSIPDRVLEIWWAYYQCEPFGSHWEQTASLASVMHANTCMLAATRGAKLDPLGVIDFVPSDAMTWRKRSKLKRQGIKHPKLQSQIIKKAFGFQ